jgi:hypothetical protein
MDASTTNRARLHNINLCDLLILINHRMISEDTCLIKALDKAKECPESHNCSECVANFMNEDYKGGF